MTLHTEKSFSNHVSKGFQVLKACLLDWDKIQWYKVIVIVGLERNVAQVKVYPHFLPTDIASVDSMQLTH